MFECFYRSAPPPPPCVDRIPVTSITTNGVSTFAEDDDIYEVPVAQEDSGMLSGNPLFTFSET